ncbi:MAG: hypothetical protein ACTS8Y_02375 [Arsenophonus sp. ER-EMS1-MAG3]
MYMWFIALTAMRQKQRVILFTSLSCSTATASLCACQMQAAAIPVCI